MSPTQQFIKQLSWQAEIVHTDKLSSHKSAIVGGMGGSNLAPDLLNRLLDTHSIFPHRTYGLPALPSALMKESLFVASSYSGNTEETLNFADMALKQRLPLAIITSGGKLYEMAQTHDLPHILLPDASLQPRNALGYSLIALTSLLGHSDLLEAFKNAADKIDTRESTNTAETIAQDLEGKVPLIYTSHRNKSLSYIYKILFNETTKIPAFANVLPEVNHNEMTGFDHNDVTQSLSANMSALFIQDDTDHPQIQKRIQATHDVYKKLDIPTTIYKLSGRSVSERVISALIVGSSAVYMLAKHYGVNPDAIPIVEDFKKHL